MMTLTTEQLSAEIQNLAQRLDKVERDFEAFKASLNPHPESEDDSEPIDLNLDVEVTTPVIPVDDAMTAKDEEAEDSIKREVEEVEDLPETDDAVADNDITDIPEDSPVSESLGDMPEVPVGDLELESEVKAEDGPSEDSDLPISLFGEDLPLVAKSKPSGRIRKAAATINDQPLENGKAVMDILAEKCAWLHDIPGPEVKSLRSAIGLGDQVLYIRRLFRDDSALYLASIEKLNSMPTIKEAVEYLGSCFPEWNMDSEDVYRFMMAVRRKIRK